MNNKNYDYKSLIKNKSKSNMNSNTNSYNKSPRSLTTSNVGLPKINTKSKLNESSLNSSTSRKNNNKVRFKDNDINNNNSFKDRNKLEDSNLDNNNNKHSKSSLDLKIEKSDFLSKFTKENLLVVVRKRPLTEKEIKYNNNDFVQILDKEQVSVLDQSYFTNLNDPKNIIKTQHFFFDYAFDEESSQEEVYQCTTKHLLEGILDGFNAIVLAYGATGSGKTFSMVGSDNNEGIMIRSLRDLFILKEKMESKNNQVKIIMTYVEVYNETILDLLIDKSESRPLELFEDGGKNVNINGVTELSVNSSNEVFKLLR